MSFFFRGKKSTPLKGIKRKYTEINSTEKKSKKFKRKIKKIQEEISSDSEEISFPEEPIPIEELPSENEPATAQEARLKLAKIYLDEVSKKLAEREDEAEFYQSHISQQLKEDLLEQTGRFERKIADQITGVDTDSIFKFRHKNTPDSVTCVVLSKDETLIYSGTKGGFITIFCLETKTKLKQVEFRKSLHNKREPILALAVSHDNKYLAVAQAKIIDIRDGTTLSHVHTFKGHNDLVTGLVFRHDTYQLYSCSNDRSVKCWSCNEMIHVETLFGHQFGVTAIDTLYRERAITSGGLDCTVRVWKIPEDSQLIYNGRSGSIDCVKLLNEDHFISGGSEGSLEVWSLLRKKALITEKVIHGFDPTNNAPNWIVSVTALLNSDLIATGSYDGYIRVWKVYEGYQRVKVIQKIECPGFINGLCFSKNGDFLVAAVAREHRLGRWWKKPEVNNSIIIFPFIKTNS